MEESKKTPKKIDEKIEDTQLDFGDMVLGERLNVERYESAGEVETEVILLNISEVFANPDQPRKYFDETALFDLSESIKRHGVIQPIVVSKTDKGFMIIAGERRYRASQKAGLSRIPAIIKDYSDRQIKEVALIENLQREDLNPIESAKAMKRLMAEFKLTQEDLAERIGKSRSSVANTLRLLTLSTTVIDYIYQNKLSAGHGRALIPLKKDKQDAFALKAIEEGWSVRDIEKAVRDFLNPPKPKTVKPKINQSAELKDLVHRMQRRFATKVSAVGNDNKGRIYIDYYTRDDLDRLSEMLEFLDKYAGND